MEQVRGRLRALALLILFAFAIDPAFFFGSWIYLKVNHIIPPDRFIRDAAFYWADLGVVAASAGLWWVAGSRRVSATRLHSVGLVYEVLICFVIALRTFWEYYRDTGILPNLTWVPAVVILFPLILPAPPRVMLAAAITSAAMAPIALFLLEATGKVTRDSMRTSTRSSVPRLGLGLPIWVRGLSTALAVRSLPPVSWAATVWRRSWGKAAWERCGAPGTACWLGPRPSSSCGLL
jgi:hypothetical protein